MNKSRKLATLLGGLTILTVSAFAQNKNTDPANNGTSMPSTTPAATPTTPVEPTPEVSTAPSSPATLPTDAAEAIRNAPPPASPDAGISGTSASRFKAMDTDNDGRISRAEFTLSPDSHWDDTNSNGTVAADGKVDVTDKTSPGKPEDKDATAAADSTITVSSNSFERFKKLDADNDGYLSPAELAVAYPSDVK